MEPNRPLPSFQFESTPHIMIIEARFYADVADLQLQAAKAILDGVHATYEIVTVPGALEIPAAIGFAIKSLNFDPIRRRPDGYIALGCVVKGGTLHDEIVGFESARGLQELSVRHALAIGNGILTCDTMEQVMERADPSRLNRSGEAALACLRMIELKNHFRLSQKRRWVGKS